MLISGGWAGFPAVLAGGDETEKGEEFRNYGIK